MRDGDTPINEEPICNSVLGGNSETMEIVFSHSRYGTSVSDSRFQRKEGGVFLGAR